MKKIVFLLAIIMIFYLNNINASPIIIPSDAIRIRVIANSDESQDITTKEEIKEELQKKVYNLLKGAESIDNAREILENNLEDINITVEKSLKRLNVDTIFKVNYGLNYFPKKEFKGIVYEEGFYESLVVTLGKGEGNNWWCVLFPPLCMIEEDTEETEYKSFVLELINKYF